MPISRRTSIGFSFPLEKSPEGAFLMNHSTIDEIRDGLRILILTNHGERKGAYTYGANLLSALFDEPGVDTKQRITDLIIAAVERWLPSVSIENIEVRDHNTDNSISPNKVKVKISFSVGPQQGTLEQSI